MKVKYDKGDSALAQPLALTIREEGVEWSYPVEKSFVCDPALSVEARLLFIMLKGYVGPNCDRPFPSLGSLARQMDRNRESIQKYLNEIEAAGYLRREHARQNGQFTSTRYALIDRSGKKPLREKPATEKAATKMYHVKERKRRKTDWKKHPDHPGTDLLSEHSPLLDPDRLAPPQPPE